MTQTNFNLNDLIEQINDDFEMNVGQMKIEKVRDNEIKITNEGFQEVDYFLKLENNKFVMTSNYTSDYFIITNSILHFGKHFFTTNEIKDIKD